MRARGTWGTTNMAKQISLLLFASILHFFGRTAEARNVGIVGGDEAKPGEIPYVVSIQDISFGYGYHFCGGAIYSEDYIVTAAQCVSDDDHNNPSILQVVAGEVNLKADDSSSQQTVLVDSITAHKDYDHFTHTNDIALIKLASPLKFDNFTKLIDMSSEKQEFSGNLLTSGWGSTSEGGAPSDSLRKATVPIVSESDCKDDYGSSDIKDSMICAGSEGKGTCQGDEGGPLVSTDGDLVLAGIASFSYGCARPGYPAVYTKISSFADWIKDHAK